MYSVANLRGSAADVTSGGPQRASESIVRWAIPSPQAKHPIPPIPSAKLQRRSLVAPVVSSFHEVSPAYVRDPGARFLLFV